jgi:hypothetical protein
VTLLGITRWNPDSRAGAVAIRPRRPHDLQALVDVTDTLRDWAEYQNLAGEQDNAETSPIQGPYDWRSYLHEEARAAKQRAQRDRPVKKASPAASAPAPSVFYA